MHSLKRIGINMVSGGAGYVIPMAINIITTPFVLSKLGEEAYGLQVLANVIIGYLIVADMGLDIPITQKIAEYHSRDDVGKQNKFLLATVKIYFIIGIAGMLLLLLVTDKLIQLLAIPLAIQEEAKIVFYLSSVGFLGSIVNMWGKAVFTGLHRYDIANGIGIFNNFFGIILGIGLIMGGYGIVGFFSARIIGFLISNLLYINTASKYILSFKLAPIIDHEVWAFLKKQIGYGFVLRMSGMIFSRMDQTLISAWVGISAVTVYSFPILIATTLSGFIASLTHFAFPMVSAMNATNSLEKLESFFFRITKVIVTISTMAFIPFILLGDKFLSLWIGPEIGERGQLVILLLMGAYYVNSCLNIGLNAFIVGMGELKYFTFYSIIRSVSLFTGFLLLIKPYGILGAGMSYMASLLVDSTFVVYTIRKKLHFSIRKLLITSYLKPVLLGVILGVAVLLVKNWVNSWAQIIAVTSIYLTLYVVFGFFIGIIDESEKHVIRTFMKKLKIYF